MPAEERTHGDEKLIIYFTWPYYKGQSYVRRLPCIKGHFYVQGINLMYHRSLYYKGQSYVKYIKLSLI